MFIGDLSHKGIRTESAAATFNLDSSITSVAAVGKPVALVGDFEVGFGADGAEIIGYLESYEERTVEGGKLGTVTWHMSAEFSYTGTAPAAGDRVASDGAGNVKVAGAGVGYNTLVTAVDTDNEIVSVLFR